MRADLFAGGRSAWQAAGSAASCGRLVRRLDGAGVSENLILAVVFFALSRDDRGTLAAFWQDDGSGEDDGSGDEDD